jgi:hypothetical protein
MRTVSVTSLLYCSALMLALPLPARAMPAITCHCFTDRTFNSTKPAAADGYFLATTQNSFFSFVFTTDKKSVVMKKQQGTSPDDLWVAYWVASASAATPESLLKAKLPDISWKQVTAPLHLSSKKLGVHFSAALNADAATARLAEAVVDELFLANHLLDQGELAALRKFGATNQELILSTVIASKSHQPAIQLCRDVRSGAKTWGSLLIAAQIDTKNMQSEIIRILKVHPQ